MSAISCDCFSSSREDATIFSAITVATDTISFLTSSLTLDFSSSMSWFALSTILAASALASSTISFSLLTAFFLVWLKICSASLSTALSFSSYSALNSMASCFSFAAFSSCSFIYACLFSRRSLAGLKRRCDKRRNIANIASIVIAESTRSCGSRPNI